MAANGRAAAATLRSYRDLIHGMCLFYVWKAYAANGASGGISSGTAMEGWNNSKGKHHGDRNPPAGVPVWFGKKPSSSAGDVVISLGNGRVICTDYPRYGVVGECTIQERQEQIGRPYLGWTETILGAEIDYSVPAPAEDNPTKPDFIDLNQENDMPINFRNPVTGVTYTMVPGYSLRAHANAFGERLTNYVNDGSWPHDEQLENRYNSGLRNLNRDHVLWMLPFYGFGSMTPESLPTDPNVIVYSDKIKEQDAKLDRILASR